MAFTTSYRVRFADVDSAGIVYYPRFLHLAHVAMEDFFLRALGRDYAELTAGERVGFPAVHLDVDFAAPLRYGDVVEIEVDVVNIGGSSVTWGYRFSVDGDDRAQARVVTVFTRLDTLTKADVPEWFRDATTLP